MQIIIQSLSYISEQWLFSFSSFQLHRREKQNLFRNAPVGKPVACVCVCPVQIGCYQGENVNPGRIQDQEACLIQGCDQSSAPNACAVSVWPAALVIPTGWRMKVFVHAHNSQDHTIKGYI